MSFLSIEHQSPNKKSVPTGCKVCLWPPLHLTSVQHHRGSFSQLILTTPMRLNVSPNHLVLNSFSWYLSYPSSLVPLVLTSRVMLMVVNELRDSAEKVLLSQVILALRCGTHDIMAYHPLRFPEEVDAKSATREQGPKGPKKWSEVRFEFKGQRKWEKHFIKELLDGCPCSLSPGP